MAEDEAWVLSRLSKPLLELAELDQHFNREAGERLSVKGQLRQAKITFRGKWNLLGHLLGASLAVYSKVVVGAW